MLMLQNKNFNVKHFRMPRPRIRNNPSNPNITLKSTWKRKRSISKTIEFLITPFASSKRFTGDLHFCLSKNWHSCDSSKQPEERVSQVVLGFCARIVDKQFTILKASWNWKLSRAITSLNCRGEPTLKNTMSEVKSKTKKNDVNLFRRKKKEMIFYFFAQQSWNTKYNVIPDILSGNHLSCWIKNMFYIR